MRLLIKQLQQGENWLIERILHYAKLYDYAQYTSTLEEAWRLSIAGLTCSIADSLQHCDFPPELNADDDYLADPAAAFGVLEARRHRERGINLSMFLGLYKYYQLSYLDFIDEKLVTFPRYRDYRRSIELIFDRIEIAFVVEWNNRNEQKRIEELQASNRQMTNEKNIYLTAFESHSSPIILVDSDWKIRNFNHEAARLIDLSIFPGSSYYRHGLLEQAKGQLIGESGESLIGQEFGDVYPWLVESVGILREGRKQDENLEIAVKLFGADKIFEVKLSELLDVSEKFKGILIILTDLTVRKRLERERESLVRDLQEKVDRIKQLHGLLPICAACKKIRDDKGYWNQIENYLHEHSGAEFSHSMCPDCAERYYGEYLKETPEDRDTKPEK